MSSTTGTPRAIPRRPRSSRTVGATWPSSTGAPGPSCHRRAPGHEDDGHSAGTFAAGDVVLVRRNASRLDVRNGERGVVQAVDRGGLYVRFGDRFRALPREFLDSTTPRRSSRSTRLRDHGLRRPGDDVRSAFVLARDDLYREWAYTAMSRGRSRTGCTWSRTAGSRDEFAPAEPSREARERSSPRWAEPARDHGERPTTFTARPWARPIALSMESARGAVSPDAMTPLLWVPDSVARLRRRRAQGCPQRTRSLTPKAALAIPLSA